MPIQTVCFDFDRKTAEEVPAAELPKRVANAAQCWIDIDIDDETSQTLSALGIPDRVIEEVLGDPVSGRHDNYNECIHLGVAASSHSDEGLSADHVDIILGETFVVTVRRGEVDFIERVRRTYRQDFEDFANSLGFLLFMLWNNLIDDHRRTLTELETEVDALQKAIFRELEDELLEEVSRVTQMILAFRKIVLGERDALHDLANRKSRFVAETTQPFLENLVGRLDRLGDDLAVEREVMAETFNLHLGLVSHRTNKIVNRLTVLSMVFLPLGFIVGVYGMNFRVLPEIEWRYGYVAFWILTVVLTASLLLYVRHKRWL